MSRTSQAPARAGTGTKASSRRSPTVRSTSRRVLLVDGDPIGLRRLRDALGDTWLVTTAAGESQAQILLDAFEYQALITVHDSSSQVGIRTLEWVRARHPKVRRLLVSECEPATLAPHLLSGLVQRFLAKPVDRQGLLAALGDPEP